MFDRVAPRYDRVNGLLSLGQDRAWRAAAARAAALLSGQVCLDVACGTGVLARTLQRRTPDARVVGVDFSEGMLRETVARPRRDAGTVWYVAGDAVALPVASGSADVVTIAFGLRNLPDPRAGLREFHRVLRPGGRLVICEFSHPVWRWLRRPYRFYLAVALPLVARLVSSDPEAYHYLVRSIAAWPEQDELAQWVAQAGFEQVGWRNLSAGLVALHQGLAA